MDMPINGVRLVVFLALLFLKTKHNQATMTKHEQDIMIAKNIQLTIENERLIKEQKEFQDALKAQVNRIKGLGPWKRFWAAAQLVIDLITTIEKGFRD